MKKVTISMILIFICITGFTQNKEYYERVVMDLSDLKYEGRNDYKNGDIKAAKYIIQALRFDMVQPVPEIKMGLPTNDITRGSDALSTVRFNKDEISYIQPFFYPLNVMRGNMEFSVDGKKYEPTYDFIMKEFSTGKKGEFDVYYLDESRYIPKSFISFLNSGEFKNSFVVIDFELFWKKLDKQGIEIYQTYLGKLTNVGGIILQYDNMPTYYKARSKYTVPLPVVGVGPNFPKNAKKVSINVENEFLKNHEAHNIIAYIKGKTQPDSCIILIAHYDHLGLMGKDIVFPGANDNASGVGMLITLAQHYSKKENRPDNSIMFIFTDGEESNLLGSIYYVNNPLKPLKKIKYLINLDMIGDTGNTITCETGGNGISPQKNRTKRGEDGLSLFKEINKEYSFFTNFIQNPLSDLSDHYPFAMNGVPSIYFTIEGDFYSYYHTPRDTAEHTSSENYNKLFKLITEFIKRY